jgi:hypothetical protein
MRLHGRVGLIQVLGPIKIKAAKPYLVAVAILFGVAVALSLLLHVPYIFTALALSAWALFGHIVTADDDLPGGWSNPDGAHAFPWVELLVKAGVFALLCAIVVLFPAVREFGS